MTPPTDGCSESPGATHGSGFFASWGGGAWGAAQVPPSRKCFAVVEVRGRLACACRLRVCVFMG
eukprot:474534-Prymnesium_polylepis.1